MTRCGTVVLLKVMCSLCNDVWDGVEEGLCVDVIYCSKKLDFYMEAQRVKAVQFEGSCIGLVL